MRYAVLVACVAVALSLAGCGATATRTDQPVTVARDLPIAVSADTSPSTIPELMRQAAKHAAAQDVGFFERVCVDRADPREVMRFVRAADMGTTYGAHLTDATSDSAHLDYHDRFNKQVYLTRGPDGWAFTSIDSCW